MLLCQKHVLQRKILFFKQIESAFQDYFSEKSVFHKTCCIDCSGRSSSRCRYSIYCSYSVYFSHSIYCSYSIYFSYSIYCSYVIYCSYSIYAAAAAAVAAATGEMYSKRIFLRKNDLTNKSIFRKTTFFMTNKLYENNTF